MPIFSQFGEIVWQRLFNIVRILKTTALKTVPGRDGLVRTVVVKTGASTTLVRPIQKLCLLEESRNLQRDQRQTIIGAVTLILFDIPIIT